MALETSLLTVNPKIRPPLDLDFMPAVLWQRAYSDRCAADPASSDLAIALSRPDGTVFVHKTRILSHTGPNIDLNIKHVERLVKFLLWQKGGSRIAIGGEEAIGRKIAELYSASGARAFDNDVMGNRIFREELTVQVCNIDEIPVAHEGDVPLGRHLDGCRIGFDLGGSDRKAAAVVDGKVVFSEEIKWDPYFEKDPTYHLEGIRASLKSAAAKMPRVDAIGGSAAGVYVHNEPRIASLFRGVSEADYDAHVRGIFHQLQEEWGGIPFDVANDGEVTALAGSMSLDDNAVLGIAMGTSLAAGYCNADGGITCALNELAFAPIDYRDDAPVDEWSGDIGCGVQYFSQQAVGRLVPAAGIELPDDMPLPERLIEVQKLMSAGDDRAHKIYESIGVYLGYALATYAEFYDIRNLLLLGRVTSGEGGKVIIDTCKDVLAAEFPEHADGIAISTPDEQLKRHGQAIAAASLPSTR